jgi:FAD/FMN-containing dehydrogenase
MEDEWSNAGYKIMKKFKDVLDPNRILNPGKLFENNWNGGDE